MYVDQYVASTMGDYVAAGTTIQSSTAYNTYARKAGVLDYEGGKLAEAPKAGETISMEIKSTEDGYSAKFGSNAAVTAGYDFALNAVDGDYVYVGIFAARSVDISASNMELTIDGQKQTNFDCYILRVHYTGKGKM